MSQVKTKASKITKDEALSVILEAMQKANSGVAKVTKYNEEGEGYLITITLQKIKED